MLPALRRFAYSLTGNVSDADDLLQSTLERLLVRGAPLDATPLHWGLKICRNLWIDDMRARRKHAEKQKAVAGSQATYYDGQRVVDGKIALAEAFEAIAHLPEPQREVLILVAVEGLTYARAAEVLDVPVGTVMSRLARARKALLDQNDGRSRPSQEQSG